jgi:hypothetical protein
MQIGLNRAVGRYAGLVLLAVAFAVSLAPSQSGALGAAPVTISTLNVDIWPEHDDPRVLVIYRGELSAGAALPYALTFAIPASGQVNAAAYRSADGALIAAQYEYRQDGERLQVTFTVPERAFQFEYYADLITGRPNRSFAAGPVFPLPVDSLRVAVEQPRRSSAFVLTPRAAGTSTTAAGLIQHLYTVGPWPAGKPWSVRASYQKTDSEPSLPRVVQTPAGAGPATRGRALPPWAWAALAAAALGVASLVAFWTVGRSRRPRGAAAAPGGPRAQKKGGRRPDTSYPAYCANCGRRARLGDRFCSRCGAALPRD